MAKKLTQAEFVKRCGKYDLESFCSLEDIKTVRKEYAREIHPDLQVADDDVAYANKWLAEVNADCDYMIAYLEQEALKREKKNSTSWRQSTPSGVSVKLFL